MRRDFASACAMVLSMCAAAGAQTVITQWNFNSVPPDGSNSTGSASASVGSGVASVFGGATFTYANGAGSSDTGTDNTGFNSSTYPTSATDPSGLRGVTFATSTANFSAIQITYDVRFSNSTSRFVQFRYSIDGVNFINFGTPLESTLGGDLFYNLNTIDLTGVSGVNNNANFKFQFSPVHAPGQGVYLPATAGSTYGSGGTGGGTLRYDMVTVSGTALVSIPPTGAATAAPSAACATGGPTTLTVAVTPGQNPTNANITVTGNLSQIGGPSTQQLFDDGSNGDPVAGDNSFTFSTFVNAGTPGSKSVSFVISDAQGRSSPAQTTVNVVDCSQNSAARVVISQVYGGGGNQGPPVAAFNADFVELFNRSALPVNITGWSVQYASANSAGGFDNPADLVPLSGIILPGQRRLVQMSTIGPAGSPLPTPDFAGSGGMGNSAGRVALVQNSTLLGLTCSSSIIEDLVGYGDTGACFEGGAPVGQLADNTSATRKTGGAQDTNQNFNDFTIGTPLPSNRASGGFLAGFAALDSSAVCAGSNVLLTVSVSPGASPVSSGISVSANLTNIGGGAAAALNDLGANGDVSAGDGVYSLLYTIPGSVSQGTKTLSFNVSDAQSRSDSSSLSLAVAQCVPSTARVVISQFFTGGNNEGATWHADFVEIFNRSQLPVDLTGWSVQYADAATATGFIASQTIPIGGIVQPGQYVLIQTQRPPSGAIGAPLPPADFSGFVDLPLPTNGFGMDNEFGRIALVRIATPLGTNTTSPDIEDLVGYGPTAINFEGLLPAARTSNTVTGVRRIDGCQDNNQNAIDIVVGPSLILPRNTSSPFNVCAVSTGRCCIGARCAIVAPAACVASGTAGVTFSAGASNCNAGIAFNTPCCFADYNKVGGIGVQDIFDFLSGWFGNSVNANVAGDGLAAPGVQDIFDFLAAWFAGGC